MNIFFAKEDHRVIESSQGAPVSVAKDSRIATPVEVIVNTLTVMQAEELGVTGMIQIPDDNQLSPNRASINILKYVHYMLI